MHALHLGPNHLPRRLLYGLRFQQMNWQKGTNSSHRIPWVHPLKQQPDWVLISALPCCLDCWGHGLLSTSNPVSNRNPNKILEGTIITERQFLDFSIKCSGKQGKGLCDTKFKGWICPFIFRFTTDFLNKNMRKWCEYIKYSLRWPLTFYHAWVNFVIIGKQAPLSKDSKLDKTETIIIGPCIPWPSSKRTWVQRENKGMNCSVLPPHLWHLLCFSLLVVATLLTLHFDVANPQNLLARERGSFHPWSSRISQHTPSPAKERKGFSCLSHGPKWPSRSSPTHSTILLLDSSQRKDPRLWAAIAKKRSFQLSPSTPHSPRPLQSATAQSWLEGKPQENPNVSVVLRRTIILSLSI